jgi:RNA polymerase sigma factor (sigma-70 family)
MNNNIRCRAQGKWFVKQRIVNTRPKNAYFDSLQMNVIPSGDISDEGLLRLACERKHEVVLEKLYHRFGNRIFKVAMDVVRNREEAEEAVQDVFIAIWKGSAHFDGKSKAYTWLYRVAVNKALERARKKNSKSSRFFWAKEYNEMERVPPDYHTPQVGMEEQEKREQANTLINRLPEKQKVAFSLFYLSELSYEEVAKAMDTTVSSVESLLFRARRNLEKFIQTYR